MLVHRRSSGGYTAQRAIAGETIGAEPFGEVELRVGMLFGDDDRGTATRMAPVALDRHASISRWGSASTDGW